MCYRYLFALGVRTNIALYTTGISTECWLERQSQCWAVWGRVSEDKEEERELGDQQTRDNALTLRRVRTEHALCGRFGAGAQTHSTSLRTFFCRHLSGDWLAANTADNCCVGLIAERSMGWHWNAIKCCIDLYWNLCSVFIYSYFSDIKNTLWKTIYIYLYWKPNGINSPINSLLG